MTETNKRMTDKGEPPDAKAVAEWIGAKNFERWNGLTRFIAANYPGVFAPDWIYGGMKHGWGLRYKKSKSFCTLIPERNRMIVVIVFGAKERGMAEAILPELSAAVREAYENATTYHDGKWVRIVVNGEKASADVKSLLTIKRAPKK